ncbi:hypothetical protein LOTGIDRAFT_150592 [Lottia gigantea]|uniref:Large ribosomal subunit protein mL43 n=1 Tax=Lottia gigantea TaxID=225164 RepID=V4A927_LOTGI|nr:hypothetical protein LOTGIDRAFT_150592 [Lottia gigantea]ESO89811.1 hypothetical protein LOTGIDRAFT_150592 [Lottia gigantea]
MSGGSIPSNFLKNVLNNGIGRYVCQMKRVTFKFCKQRNDSQGTRDFIENHLLDFTNAHPGVVVYIQPRNNRPSKIVAEYLNGRSEGIATTKMPQEEICQWLEHLRTRSGAEIVRLRKNHHTDNPSTQGVWHPFTNKDTSLNLAKFPDNDSYKVPSTVSTTDRLLEMGRKLRQEKLSEKS